MNHRVWVEIDLNKLVRNYRLIAERVAPAKVLCVLKANAYGLGVARYAKALAEAGCESFGVAEPFEALELKRILGENCSIQILSSILPDEIAPMVAENITLPVIDEATAVLIADAARKMGKIAKVHFKLDTGMGRLGIRIDREADIDDTVALFQRIAALPGLDCEGIFTHFPMAYDPLDPFTIRQIELFRKLLQAAEAKGLVFRRRHCAASDAINNFPMAAMEPFNFVRTGINLHGSFDPNGLRAMSLESVLTLKTRVAQVRTLPAGATLGYGRTWCLREPTRVATISAGYADGLPLALTNRGRVLIGGKYCRFIGRISMDYSTIDVTDLPEVQPGDEVVCFGSVGGNSITPDDWAALKGTHAYDIICSLGNRVERVFID